MSKTSAPVKETPGSLVKALHHLLRPMVRLLMHFQITYPAMSGFLKQIYVDVAVNDFKLDGKAQTDSRVSLLTGVHRKDVKRLRENNEEFLPSPAISLGAQLIARWLGDREYLDENGSAKPLPRTSDSGASFESLVKTAAKQDIRARAVLDEWLNLGVVRINDDDTISLNAEAFVPQDNFDDKAFFFGKHLHDHISAGVHNMLNGTPPQFDRGVFYNNLTPDSIEVLRRLIARQATELLIAVNNQAKQLQIQDRGKTEAHQRFNLGAYFWVENQPTKEDNDG
ncbi:MAG: hypothetical protein CSA52_01185 [Gammaproteobacteria bacterium]|nr:MAG: hypothetical protein CSB48_13095 [Pseudomonadota bacterium]PIE38794.1 MAG: hypothetical protein CSA52_01185 [Gammaproteobacteria bacterium]